MKTISYKGYTASLEYDAENGYLYGEVLDINDSISFDGETEPEAIENFKMMLNEYLDYCKAIGKKPDVPHQETYKAPYSHYSSPFLWESVKNTGTGRLYTRSSLALNGG